MTDKKSWFEMVDDAPVPISFINEPIEPEPENAAQRARRRWGMIEDEHDEAAWKAR
jgi:hypothetical protein